MTEKNSQLQFNTWAETNRVRLIRIAMSILRDAEEPEDLVQELLFVLWMKHENGAITNLDAYSRRAVWVNALKLKVRKRDIVPFDEHISGLAAYGSYAAGMH